MLVNEDRAGGGGLSILPRDQVSRPHQTQGDDHHHLCSKSEPARRTLVQPPPLPPGAECRGVLVGRMWGVADVHDQGGAAPPHRV